MKKVKEFFIVVLSILVCFECVFFFRLNKEIDEIAGETVNGLIITGNVYGDIGVGIDPTYITVTLPEDYYFDDGVTIDSSCIEANVTGELVCDVDTYTDEELTLIFTGLVNSELMSDIVITIDGQYIIYDGDPQTGYVWTNGDDCDAHYFIEASGSPCASLKENKVYNFKRGFVIDKDLIEIDIDNDAIVGNTYNTGDNFNDESYFGLSIKVDSVVRYGSYIKKMYVYLDGTPNATGELTINDLLIPSTNRVSATAADGYKGIITSADLAVLGDIKITVTENPPMPIIEPDPYIDYDPIKVK